MAAQNRHRVLDIGRLVAILSVMLFHYFSAWANRGATAYPYGHAYDYFSWGHLGVEFFFVLTGFFIIESLQRSVSLLDFWKKKLVRLGVPLVLCSILTFTCFRVLDTEGFIPASGQWKNLLVSCLFISPDVINLLLDTKVEYVNHSYWFLWVEFQFLVLASVVFFADRKHFARNFGVVSLLVYVLWFAVRKVVENYFLTNKFGIPFSIDTMLYIKDWVWLMKPPTYLFYFVFGIVCSVANQNIRSSLWLLPTMAVALINNPIFSCSQEHVIIWSILLLWVVYVLANERMVMGGYWCVLRKTRRVLLCCIPAA